MIKRFSLACKWCARIVAVLALVFSTHPAPAMVPRDPTVISQDSVEMNLSPRLNMRISANGLAMIRASEGLSLLYPVHDSDGRLSIGYGHTKDVTPHMKINERQAEIMLQQDVRIAEKAVLSCVHVPLSQNEFDALTSFTFNLGAGTLKNSQVVKYLNRGLYSLAADDMRSYTHIKGKHSHGLAARREREFSLFMAKAA